MSEAAISVEGLVVRYDAAPALRQVSLAVPRGAFAAIVGPNGSGKTTLLRAIGALVAPAAGGVWVEGVDVSALRPRDLARRVGGVPQEGGSGHGFAAGEIVLMGRLPHLGRLRNESAADLTAARDAMARAGVWELRGRPFDALSGGERQRVLLARALAQEPRVLLLDEPTAHLDVRAQLEIMDLLAAIGDVTVVAAIHDLNLASLYADLMVLLAEGRVVAMGAPSEVVTRAHLRAAYRTDVIVRPHPRSGRPYVTVARPEPEGSGAGLRVHVLGGGGTARALLDALAHEGFDVRAGPLNLMDSDLEAARALGVPAIEEAPFSPLGVEAVERARAWIAQADAVVLTAIPFGVGNAQVLDLAREAAEGGIPVAIVDAPVEPRDFTGGTASAAYLDLRRRAIACPDELAAVEALRRIAAARSVGTTDASQE